MLNIKNSESQLYLREDDQFEKNPLKSDHIQISTRSVINSSNESIENLNISENKKLFDFNNLEESLNSYLKIDSLKNDFDIITQQFENSIYESMLKSNNCMLPCFDVTCSNFDKATGLFAIIDIGGSTLRISVVKFLDNRKAECIINESWIITDSNKHLDIKFFKWIAKHFESVIDDNLRASLKNSNGKIKLGITWSFPIIQNIAPNRAIVSDLGKGFSISDEYKGKDLKFIFEENFRNFNIPIEVYSIVNDSTSVFIAGSYFNNSKLSLVQGTGVNACFLIDSNILGFEKRNSLKGIDENCKVLINSESSFLAYHLHNYITQVDIAMHDTWSLMGNDKYLPPHLTTDLYGVFQPLEVITSGRYIPEIIRRIAAIEKLCPIFSSDIGNEYKLNAEGLSRLYKCTNIDDFKLILQEITDQTHDVKSIHISTLKIITDAVIHRASLILASYIISLLRVTKFNNNLNLEVSVVGSMLRYFPGYKEKVLEVLKLQSEKNNLPIISFDFIDDSSIYGASIAAYVNQEKMNL